MIHETHFHTKNKDQSTREAVFVMNVSNMCLWADLDADDSLAQQQQ